MKGNFKKIDQQSRYQEIQERERLEEMLEDIPSDLGVLTNEAINLLKKRKVVKLDYDDIKEEINRESDDIVDTSAEFYFDKSEIQSEPYLQQKVNVYKITVSNLLFQMKTAEHAIIKLLEKIDEGAGVDRTFEVLAGLQKSKMEIVKHLSGFMVVMENNLKEIRNDFLSKVAEGRGNAKLELSEGEPIEELEVHSEKDEHGNIRVRGTRSLIQSLREIADKNIEDVNGEDMDDV